MNNMDQDNRQQQRPYNTWRAFSNFTAGMMTGLAVGGILGILFAPDKGSETRRKIRSRVNEVEDKIGNKMHNMKQSAENEVEKVKQMRRNAEEQAKEKLESIAQKM